MAILGGFGGLPGGAILSSKLLSEIGHFGQNRHFGGFRRGPENRPPARPRAGPDFGGPGKSGFFGGPEKGPKRGVFGPLRTPQKRPIFGPLEGPPEPPKMTPKMAPRMTPKKAPKIDPPEVPSERDTNATQPTGGWSSERRDLRRVFIRATRPEGSHPSSATWGGFIPSGVIIMVGYRLPLASWSRREQRSCGSPDAARCRL